MVRRGGGFSAPGTRVSKIQTEKGEYRTYIIQAAIAAVSCDIVLFGLIVILLSVGWPVLFIASLFIAYYGTLATISIYEKFSGRVLAYQASMRLAWAFVFSIAFSDFFFISGWWEWIIAKEMILIFVIETFSPLNLPSWIYFSLTGLWFIGALKKWGKITLTLIVICLTIWTVSQIDYSNIDFSIIWSRIRYFSATLIVPWIMAGLILTISMIKEMVAPNMNFVLETIPWSDYKQAGGFLGLLFPKLIEWKEQIGNRVAYNVSIQSKLENGHSVQQKRRTLFAPAKDAEGLANYAQAIFDGRATFSEKGTRDGSKKGATSFGYTQSEYSELRMTMHQLGMLDKKGNNYTLNELGIESLQGVIDRTPLP